MNFSRNHRIRHTTASTMADNSPDTHMTPLERSKWVLRKLKFFYSYYNFYAMSGAQAGAIPAREHEAHDEDDEEIAFPYDFDAMEAEQEDFVLSPVFTLLHNRIEAVLKSQMKLRKCTCPSVAKREKCGDGCQWRELKVECGPECGRACKNRRIQKREFCLSIRIDSRKPYGFCLTATDAIPSGTMIQEIIGEFTSGKLYANQPFAVHVSSKYARDGSVYLCTSHVANETRYIQHATNPNCRIEEWVVAGKLRLILVADKDIDKHEVITVKLNHHIDKQFKLLTEEKQTAKQQAKRNLVPGPKPSDSWQTVQPKDDDMTEEEKLATPFPCIFHNCLHGFQSREELEEHVIKKHLAKIPDVRPAAARARIATNADVREGLRLPATNDEREAFEVVAKEKAASEQKEREADIQQHRDQARSSNRSQATRPNMEFRNETERATENQAHDPEEIERRMAGLAALRSRLREKYPSRKKK